MQTITETERVLAEMLTENTGRHLLDSGGAYGRNWERNKTLAGNDPVAFFKERPEAFWDYGPTLDVFHFLVNRLEYAPKLDRAFRTFVEMSPIGTRYTNGPGAVDEFIDQLAEKGWAELNGSHDFSPMTVNTYNGEDYLTQVLQYVVVWLTDECPWADEGEDYYVFLSIHGGCDVRGGYTDLRAFSLGGYEGVCALLDNARAEFCCSNDACSTSDYGSRHNWTLEGGYWLYDGGTGGPDPEFPEDDKYHETFPSCPFCHQPLSLYAPYGGR